jgi:hypothetical protein
MADPKTFDPEPDARLPRGRLGNVDVLVVTGGTETPAAEAQVVEQDCCFVLSARGPVTASRESYAELVAGMLRQRGADPGSVLVHDRQDPIRLEAIVHDLDREPSWRAEWIAQAVDGILTLAGERGWRSLRLPVLGRVHGRFDPAEFVALLAAALPIRANHRLEQLWLEAPEAALPALIAALRAGADGAA